MTSVTSKALAILGAFDVQHRELTLTELARRSDLTLSTAQRRAAELTSWGALERTDAGHYRIGVRLQELGSLAARGPGLRELVRPLLRELFLACGHSVQLVVRTGPEAVTVECITSGPSAESDCAVGSRCALAMSAAGLVLLAAGSVDPVSRVVVDGLPTDSSPVVGDRTALSLNLAAVRRDGYALSSSCGMAAEDSVAAPVFGRHGRVVAAVAVTSAAAGGLTEVTTRLVRASAHEISRALSAYGPRQALGNRSDP